MEIKNVKMFVLDYEANATFDRLKATLDNFVKCLRKKYSIVPIVIISKIQMYLEFHDEVYIANEKKVRKYQKDYVKKSNDENLYYIDGAKVLGKSNISEKTVDGCHPTDYGFISMAEYLYHILTKITSFPIETILFQLTIVLLLKNSEFNILLGIFSISILLFIFRSSP